MGIVRWRDEGDHIKVFIPVPEGVGIYSERHDIFVEVGRIDYREGLADKVYTELVRFTADPAKSIWLVPVRD